MFRSPRIASMLPLACLSLAVAACSTGRDMGDGLSAGLTSVGSDGSATGGGGITTSAGTDGSGGPTSDGGTDGSGETGDGATTGTTGDSTGGILFDVGDGVTAGSADDGGTMVGCNKVDFLFVIDNSQSMEDDQVRLINAFPQFIDGIQNTIAADDYHIGVITSDDHVYDYDTYYGGQQKTECDVMGGLVTENWDYTTNTQRFCGPFASGQNYMTQNDADLVDKFSCTAFVDDEGSTDEAPMEAITSALAQPTIPCNEGFLRDDALLVIVVITDEDDDHEPGGNPGSVGDPADWYQAVMDAKNNDPTHAVVLALAGTPDCTYEHTVRIEQWVSMFGTNGFMGPVCVDEYGDFFKDSVTVVDEACDSFVPPG